MWVKTIFFRPTFVISIHVDQEMASNDFSLSSSSDSEVSEMEDYELEVEGSPNSRGRHARGICRRSASGRRMVSVVRKGQKRGRGAREDAPKAP